MLHVVFQTLRRSILGMRTSKTDMNEEDVGSYGGRKETVSGVVALMKKLTDV